MHFYPRVYNRRRRRREEEISNFPPSLWDIAGPGYLRKESSKENHKGKKLTLFIAYEKTKTKTKTKT